MSYDPDRLYNLLPAVHRIRDAEQGEPLRQLLALITQQAGILEEDLEQLYDNQFIETCAPWVLPYIGDLIGYRSLHPIGPDQLAPRAEVANTIGYRRRKGTASVLEQLARDVSAWNARAVEFFQLLGTTQFMNHIRLTNLYAPDLRQWEPLERLSTAFETSAHTIDVRHIERTEGKYNIPNIGIFLWRLNAFRLRSSPAVRVDPNDDHRFLFNPLGVNAPLFTRPQTEGSITHLAEPINVPEPISRRVLDASLASYYGKELSIFVERVVSGGTMDVGIDDVAVCNLSDKSATTWAHAPPPNALVAIDPVLGRISFRHPQTELPRVTYHYGFGAAIGGGEYERTPTFDAALTLVATVASPNPIQPALQPALQAGAGGGVVELSDSGRFEETPSITLNSGARLEIRAANGHRPTLSSPGWVDIYGATGSELTLNGLFIIGGKLRVHSGYPLRRLRLVHCTIVPGAPSLSIEHTHPTDPIEIEIDHSIVGAIRVPANATVLIRHSIVDANSDTAVAYADLNDVGPGGTVSVVNSTIIGTMHTEFLKLASNSIFLARTNDGSAPVRSERRQVGCVRFSWLPLTSRVPRRYRCQPDLEIAKRVQSALAKSGMSALSNVERQAIEDSVVARLVPAFTSLRLADPGYCQLLTTVPEQIRTGADDQSEMGAFHDLFQPQRESNIRARLREYLRFGLEAGVFYST